ncbi:DUF560 domain-containing protein [bacterium]|nr:DUF560 domain-containing protein [bacterium]
MTGPLRRAVRAALLAGAASLLSIPGSGVAWTKPAVLNVDQMRAFGAQALLNGYAEQALQIAETLLTRDPQDAQALILKAQALRILQHLPDSEAAARAGWAAADTPALRFAAASAVAQALSLQDHRTRAQFWLRRAVQNAPNAAAQGQALQDFAYVRSQNPLSLQVDASLRPSDNVNGGARDPLFEYQGIPFILSGDALALSGLAWGLGVQGRLKLGETATSQTALTFAASQQGVILSDSARAQAPNARNGDYALGHVEAGLEYKTASPLGLLTTGLTGGHSWYGGSDLSNSVELSFDLAQPVGPGLATWSTSVTRQIRLDRPVSSSTETDVGATYDLAGPRGDQWQAGLTLARVASQDIGIDHAEASLGLGWQARQPVAGLGFGASLSLRGADYAASPFTAIGRHDVRWAASLTAEIDKMTYLGFAPVLSLDFSRNRSNVALYDTQTAGISLSVKSRF